MNLSLHQEETVLLKKQIVLFLNNMKMSHTKLAALSLTHLKKQETVNQNSNQSFLQHSIPFGVSILDIIVVAYNLEL